MLGSVLLHLLDGVGDAFPEMGRGYPKHAGDHATAGSGHHNSAPAELPEAEDRHQHRDGHQRRAAGLHIGDVGDESGGDDDEHAGELPPTEPPRLARASEQRKRAKRENAALGNVILDRNARHLATPGQARDRRQSRGCQQQRHRGAEEPEHDRPAPLRAPELGQQKRNQQKLAKSLEALKTLAQARLRPRHAERRDRHQDDRQPARGAHDLPPHAGGIDDRNQRHEPSRQQNAGPGGRPRQRRRHGDREPLGEPCAPCVIEPVRSPSPGSEIAQVAFLLIGHRY